MSEPFNLSQDPEFLALADEHRKRKQYRGEMTRGVKMNPDEYAKAVKLSAQTDTMPEAVLHSMKEFEVAARVDALDKIRGTSPRTAAFLQRNPELAHDDAENLAKLEGSIKKAEPEKSWKDRVVEFADFWNRAQRGAVGGDEGKSFLGSYITGANTLGRGALFDIPRMIARPYTMGNLALQHSKMPMVDWVEENVFKASSEFGQSMVKPEHWVANAIGGSLPQMSISLAGPMISGPIKAGSAGTTVLSRLGNYIASRSPQLATQSALSMPSVLSAEADEFQKFNPTASRDEAVGKAAVSAAAQSLLEGLVEVPVIERMQKSVGVTKRITGLLMASQVEGAEEVAQRLVSQALLPDTKGRTFTMDELWENYRGGAVAGGLFGAASIAGPRVTTEEAFFQSLADGARDSKLLKRLPSAHQEAVHELVKDGPLEHMRMNPEAFVTYYQAQGLDPVEVAQSLGVKNLMESRLTGNDILIPTAAYATQIAGTEHHAELSKDLKLTEDSMTLREQEAAEGAVQELVNLPEAVDEEAQAKPEFQSIKAELKARYEAAGESSAVADTYATDMAKVFQVMSGRVGMTPTELFAQYAPRIVRGEAPKPQEVVRDMFDEETFPEEGVAWQEGEDLFFQASRDAEPVKVDAQTFYQSGIDRNAGAPNLTNGGTPDAAQSNLSRRTGIDAGFGNVHGSGDASLRDGGSPRRSSNPDDYALRLGPIPEGPVFHGSGVADLAQNSLSIEHAREGNQLAKGLYVTDERGVDETQGATKYGRRNGTGSVHEVNHRIEAPVDLGVDAIFSRDEAARVGVHLPEFMDEVSGPTLWRMMVRDLGGMEEAKAELMKLGYDSAHYIDNMGKRAWVIWDQASVGDTRPVERDGVAVDEPSQDSGKTFYQPQQDDFSFGSKKWNEHYRTILGKNARGKGDRAARARQAMDRANSEQGQREFDFEQNEAAKAEAEAFAAFDRAVGRIAKPRGWFTRSEDGTFLVGKTPEGDFSTFIHEPAHAYLEMFSDLAQREGASAQLKADAEKVLKFLGVESFDKIGTPEHEKWARANETYAREGKAPSQDLRPVFERFNVWLQSVYRYVSELEPLNDDIRGVFDRMRATDEEIAVAHAQVSGPELFTSAEQAGWSEKDIKAYAIEKDLEIGEAREAILKALNEAAMREKSSEWKAEEREVRVAISALVDDRPDMKAIRLLRKGTLADGTPFTLSRDALVEQFGEDRTKTLLKRHPGIYRVEGTMDAEAAAELLGFESGDGLMQALEDAPRRGELIESGTRQVMTERHGDIRFDGTLSDQVKQALENEQKAKRLHRELAKLHGQVEQVKEAKAEAKAERKAAVIPPVQTFREAARVMVTSKAIIDLNPNAYLNGMRKSAREAFKLNGQGKFAEAAEAKKKELLNHFMYLEAVKAKAEAEKAFAYMKKFDKPSTRERLGKAGGASGQHVFLDQIDSILEQFQFVPMSNKDVRAMSLDAFAAAHEEDGIVFDPLALPRPKNYRELTIGEILAVRDAVKNIETAARNQLEMLRDGKRVNLEAEVEGFEKQAIGNHKGALLEIVPEGTLKPAEAEKKRSNLGRVSAFLGKLEWWVDQLDGGAIDGPARRNIKKPIDDASGRVKAVGHRIFKALEELEKARPSKDRKDLYQSTGIKFPNRPGTLNRLQLTTWFMNLGTEENRKVALQGEGLILEDGSVSPIFDQAIGALRSSEVAWAQGVLDLLETLKPDVEAHALRETGLVPEWKKPAPLTFKTVDGQTVDFRGGYLPLKPDRMLGDLDNKPDDLAKLATGNARPSTSKSHLKKVTGATYRLSLDYTQTLSRHLQDVIQTTYAGEAINQVYRFISHPKVRETMLKTLGPELQSEFLPWLQDFSNMGKGIVTPMDPLLTKVMRFRSAMVVAQLGGNVMSLAVQTTDPLKAIADPDFKSRRYLLPAYVKLRMNSGLLDEIRELSPNVMRYREETWNREINELLTHKGPFDAKLAAARLWFMHAFSVVDRFNTSAAWLGRFDQGMKEHGDKARAAEEADRLIKRAYQAGDAVNMSRAMRTEGWTRVLTTFGGDANTWYGILDASVRSKNVHRIGGVFLLLAAERILGQLIRLRWPDDDEDELPWLLEQAGMSLFDKIPVLGDAGEFFIAKARGKRPDMKNPVASGIERTFNGIWAGVDYLQDKKDAEEAVMGAAEAAVLWFGVPGTPLILKGWKYDKKVRDGKESPDNAVEYAAGVVTGAKGKK